MPRPWEDRSGNARAGEGRLGPGAPATLARTPRSPAVATSVVVVLQAPAPARFVPLLFGSTVLLVLTGCAASRVRAKAPTYPAYWW